MKNRLHCWFVCAILCLTVTATAQVSTGTPVLGSFSSGPDVINLGNLNVHFAIPVFSKPGRGTPFDYILSLDSSVWTPVTVSGTQSWQPDPNWGWRAITEAATGFTSRQRNTVQCLLDPGDEYIPPRPPRYGNFPQWTNYQYHDAFGVNHSGFTNILGGCVGDTDPSTSVSMDTAGWTLDTTSGIKLTTPQGKIVVPPLDLANGAATVTDRNGNQITTTSGSTFTDTLGTTALTVTGGAPSPLVMTYTTTTGTSASVTVTYVSKTVQTKFSCTGISEYGPTSIPLVSTVTMPDGSSYSFDYEATPTVPTNVTGRISKITLRTGGTIQYAYSGGSSGIECVDGSTAGFSRTTMDGVSSYSRTGSGTAWTTTYTDASSSPNQTIINFQTLGSPSNFYETHRVVNQGSPAGTIATTDTCYNSAVQPHCSTTAITTQISEIKKYIILSSTQNLTDVHLNGFGMPTEIDEYDFGAAPHGSLLRTTFKSYASLGNGIVGLPSSITIKDGGGAQKANTVFGYDETGATATSGVPQHASVTGSRGNLTTSTQWVDASPTTLASIFTYDDTGNLLNSKDPAGNITTFDYTDNFSDSASLGSRAYITKVTMPTTGTVTHITQSQYEVNTGLLMTSTDPNGNATTYTYDSSLRHLSINAPDGGQTSLSYPSATSSIQSQKITATQTTSTSTNLDALGRVLQQQLTTDPSGTDTTDITYDTNGLVHSVSNPHRTGTSPTDGVTAFTYDALGRVTKVTEQDANTISAAFTDNCMTITDEASKQRKACFDGAGRINATVEPDSSSVLDWETDTAYDPLDNIISITQKGNAASSLWRTRTFSYDGLSRITQSFAPESGTTTYAYKTSGGSLCAGTASVACRVTDARSITTTLAYDALSRLTGKTYSDSTPTVSYAYDQSSVGSLTITNGNGLRTSMTDGSGSTAWSFDKLGRVLTRQQTIATVTKSIGFTYNLDGSVATMASPSGRTYTYTYNNAGQVSTLKDLANNLNFFSSPQYAPPGMLTSGIHGAVTGWNAITLTNTYNSRLQPTQYQAVSPLPSTLLNLSYSYDRGGGINNGSVMKVTNGRDSSRTVSYTYDQLNRLASAQTASTWGDSYGYDAWGNLLQKNVIVGTAESMALTVNANNHVTSPAFTYDASGNVTSDTSTTMTYDAQGRMNPTTGTTYTYDGDGRRVKKSDGTVYWIDDNFHPVSIGTTSGSLTKDFVFLGDKRIAFVSLSSGAPYFYLSDRLGSTAVIGSGDGKTIQWEADYFPFGAQQQVFTSSVNNSYQFTGYEYDSDTLYNYSIARFDSGRWGRFMSPDPYMGSIDITNPQSLNRYSYVLNNPLNLVDPLGLNCVVVNNADGTESYYDDFNGGMTCAEVDADNSINKVVIGDPMDMPGLPSARDRGPFISPGTGGGSGGGGGNNTLEFKGNVLACRFMNAGVQAGESAAIAGGISKVAGEVAKTGLKANGGDFPIASEFAESLDLAGKAYGFLGLGYAGFWAGMKYLGGCKAYGVQ